MEKATEVNDIKDFFLAEKIKDGQRPIYMVAWETNTDYYCLVNDKKFPKRFITNDYIEVPLIMPDPCDNAETEMHKFLDYIVDNHKDLGIECLPENQAMYKLRKEFSKVLKYKNVLVKEDSLVMPFNDESYGLGLLDTKRMIIISPQ